MNEEKIKAWSKIKHFSWTEFDSPDLVDSGLNMNLELVLTLDMIREDVKTPLFITSGFRTPQHNAKVSKVEKSEHTTGNAADIACSDGIFRDKIVRSAMKHGVRRLGIAKGFVHIGFSYDLPQDVIWLY
jgi:uncharacterized protein YcbK (DUF882 family)